MLRRFRRLLLHIGVKFENTSLESAYQKWQKNRVYTVDMLYLMGTACSAAMFPVYSGLAFATSFPVAPETCQDPGLHTVVHGQDPKYGMFALTLLIMVASTWAKSNDRYHLWRSPMLWISYFFSLYTFLDINVVHTVQAYSTVGETGAKYIVTTFLIVTTSVVGFWAQWEVVVLRLLLRYLVLWPGPSIAKYMRWNVCQLLFIAVDVVVTLLLPTLFAWIIELENRRLFMLQHDNNCTAETRTTTVDIETRVCDIWSRNVHEVQQLLELRSPTMIGNVDLLLYLFAPLLLNLWTRSIASTGALA